MAERQELAQRIRNAPHLSGLLRNAVLRLVSAVPPIRSVKALARSLGCSTSILRANFARLDTGWRLKDLVDWFVLVHYRWLDRGSAVAAREEASPPTRRTLNAMARRLLEKTRTAEDPPGLADHSMIERLLEPDETRCG
jgi:hypothetical protein